MSSTRLRCFLRSLQLRLYVFGLVATLGSLRAGVPVGPGWQELMKNSPFGAEPQKPADPSTQSWEFRGYVYEDRELLLCVSRVDQSGCVRSSWLNVGQTLDDMQVVGFDRDTLEIAVLKSGQTAKLALKVARVQVIDASAATQVATLEAQPEKTRLENVAAEIRRRRALRQQAAIEAKNEIPEESELRDG
jgi:hypothetical protein